MSFSFHNAATNHLLMGITFPKEQKKHSFLYDSDALCPNSSFLGLEYSEIAWVLTD